ncbi:MAG: hypothetical protein J6Y48_15560, partial [Clostridia bacterium]|nr:hypothetical protein [Clostridia bacterium]
GYDGIKYLNQHEGGAGDYSYIALRASDVRSADTVVYDRSGNPVPLDQRFSDNPAAQMDEAYFSAVDSGDMEAAQQEVDKAAEQAGYTVKAYHGTPEGGFTVFDTSRIANGRLFGNGIYFTDDKTEAGRYAAKPGKNQQVYESYLDLGDKPLEIDYDKIRDKVGDNPLYILSEIRELYKTEYADATSIVVRNRDKSGRTMYILKDPSQVKSADTVVYDDEGNPIPLSERFQPSNPDIRYSAGQGELSEAQKAQVPVSDEDAIEMDAEESDGEETHYGDHRMFSLRVTDPEELSFLNGQKTVKTYKTMQLIDGKLYPPMAAIVGGSMEDHSVLGEWEKATEHPELIKYDKNGKPIFTLKMGKGKQLDARYNPYMHSSNLMINDQFSGAYGRPELVTVECEVPVSEETSGYQAEGAKDSVGWHGWHTGTVAGQIRNQKGIERQVFLSRWIKPVRIVPESEVAAHYAELLEGTDIEVPDTVVTPALRQALEEAGVPIKRTGNVRYHVEGGELSQAQMDQAQREAEEAKNSDFAKEYDAWDGKTRGIDFVVGKPSQPLIDLGVPDNDVVLTSDKILHIKKKHPAMSDGVIKQIPSIINNPILVMKSRTVDDRITMFGTVVDDNGTPVLAVITKTPTRREGSDYDFIVLNSAYGKDTDLQGFIDNSDVLYQDKERADAWATGLRLYLPSGVAPIGSSADNIADSENTVNTPMSVGSTELSDSQREQA